jgi:hypothetical protein
MPESKLQQLKNRLKQLESMPSNLRGYAERHEIMKLHRQIHLLTPPREK